MLWYSISSYRITHCIGHPMRQHRTVSQYRCNPFSTLRDTNLQSILWIYFRFSAKNCCLWMSLQGHIELYIEMLRHIRVQGKTFLAAVIIFVRLWCVIFSAPIVYFTRLKKHLKDILIDVNKNDRFHITVQGWTGTL